jgi:hypothetical protein
MYERDSERVILNVEMPYELVPLIILIGLILVIIGRETLEVLSFAIGALAGGIIAYMVLNGLLMPYDIPLWIKLLVATILIFGGGMLGRGAMATMLAMATSLVMMDVLDVLIGPDLLFVTILAGILMFALFVALIQKYVHVFSAFLGGAIIAIPLNLITMDDVVMLRMIQFGVAVVLTVIGSFVQVKIKDWKDRRGEKVVWVPS